MKPKKDNFNTLKEKDLETVSLRFKALSDVSRLKIVQALKEGERSVTEIVEFTKLSQPNVSRHLQVLTTSGLIGKRRNGLSIMYRIVDKSLSSLCSVVCRSVKAEVSHHKQ